ncbi:MULTISPECIES: sensor histidine kinase [Streptosporangium]|uniref:histidine kinase n=1 Tax=Streptosporangium brasiliense TaxID=47480 RepID=A0ABT9QV65_9ACTN|nr:sensor histidine kinase [Streptosporangium brasiliense]MDP9860849.1 signal transduction histidine kinase [Streptosporangium brasiliense]
MFGRLRAWSRRHPSAVDALWLAPFMLACLGTVVGLALDPELYLGQSGMGFWGYLGLGVVLVVPLFWRRRWPLTVFAIVSTVSFGQWLSGVEATPFNMAVLIAMYAVASLCSLRWAIAAGLVAELGLALSFGQITTNPDPRTFASASVFVVAIWIAGIYANTRRHYLESLEERAERAERERDQQAQLAAAAERARIARELHDVVAHNVSVIIVQADGAGYAIDSDPEQARKAMQAISVTGRQALAEMRRMVGVLRTDGAAVEEEYAPQPSLSQLDDLVAQVRSSGLPVDFQVTGAPQELPEGEQLTVYRIVQEALTNTLKHGGPDTRATVEMEYGLRELLLRVTDDGRGAAAPGRPGGHGLVGMRERAAMFGGSVEARPRMGGGFQVTARLPIGETGRSRAA